MKSRANIAGHPLHPMLITLPIGLWVFSFISDLFYFSTAASQWGIVAAYSMAGGCVGALVAALPGLVDYATIKPSPTKRIATWHMMLNFFVLFLFTINFFFRLKNDYDPSGLSFILSLIAVIALGISGWLGGDLVYSHKMAVIEDPT